MYNIIDRLRCNYNGRDFSGQMTVTLPTPIMIEAAEAIESLTRQRNTLAEGLKAIADTSCFDNCATPGCIGCLSGRAHEALKDAGME